ncbi:serine/threonine-protein kinase [Deinococcus multiflagellatus]|uniref:serine/threonine-protein kinase n=1 Tax=Deinococcus multiflagellatus TaxID=1656887 RepID=UPI001CCB207D|nr:serine/threonine-protein kinase [Deinococcus multiflagellatus]MBZ9713036.1 serine/threonine protein kinase [Deinococcus multiflagellatus]
MSADLSAELQAREALTEHGGVRGERALWRGQTVFVKTLLSDSPDLQARFLHEGQVASRVACPLIVSPLLCTARHLLFPFVPGGTLRERLDLGGPLGADEATQVTAGVLMAAAHLHARGVTHQDLKPENVLLAGGEPSAQSVRVIDFGMSHARDLPLDIHSGTRMGTPHFMAPEQFLGLRGEPRSDLYSAGVLLFDCLAGAPPYEDALGWLAGIHDRRAALPGPAALHGLLRAALGRDPDDRPASARQMLRDLQAARAELGLPPVPEDLCP